MNQKMDKWLVPGVSSFLVICVLAIATSESRVVEIVCQKSFFTPEKITVKKGELVKIRLKSADVTHGFAIDAFNIAVEVPAGGARTIEFTPDRAGTFEFYCAVRCGKKHLKMRGFLKVE